MSVMWFFVCLSSSTSRFGFWCCSGFLTRLRLWAGFYVFGWLWGLVWLVARSSGSYGLRL